MLTFIDGEPLKAGLLLRGSTVVHRVHLCIDASSGAMSVESGCYIQPFVH